MTVSAVNPYLRRTLLVCFTYEAPQVDPPFAPVHEREAADPAGLPVFRWRPVRPIPADDDFFENVWREYREHGNVY